MLSCNDIWSCQNANTDKLRTLLSGNDWVNLSFYPSSLLFVFSHKPYNLHVIANNTSECKLIKSAVTLDLVYLRLLLAEYQLMLWWLTLGQQFVNQHQLPLDWHTCQPILSRHATDTSLILYQQLVINFADTRQILYSHSVCPCYGVLVSLAK